AKSRRPSHVPASRPITSSPACASGSAATPPAAPIPTITTSVSLSLVGIAHLVTVGRAVAHRGLVERLVVVGRPVIRLQLPGFEGALIRRRDHRPYARVAEEIPADEVGVAAVGGIAEHALTRVRAQHR